MGEWRNSITFLMVSKRRLSAELPAHRFRIVHRWLEYHPGVQVEFLSPSPVVLPEVQPSGQCGSP